MKILSAKIFEGVNIYSHYPVIKITLDLGELSHRPTTKFGNFNTKLLAHIPSLQEHHCSLSIPGGFVKRLCEGTYLGHVIEHIILELQHLAGSNVVYGKTKSGKEETICEIIYEYETKEGGIQAAHSAIYIVDALMQNKEVAIESEVRKIKEKSVRCQLGPSTKALYNAALEKNIPVIRLGEGSFLQLGYGKYQKKLEATITGLTSCIGVDIAADKALTKMLLAEAGIPVPNGSVCREEDKALDIAYRIGQSVVVKPYDGNQGKGVALDLISEDEILKAFAVAQNYSENIIVEKYITGRHYRLLVVGERVVAASERIPAFVVGDGRHSIKELIEITNQDPLRGEGHEKPLTKITHDPVVLMVLAKKGMNLDYIPQQSKMIYLRENANLSTGGVAIDVTEDVHPENLELALRAARIIGLDVAGIDLVAEDISKPINEKTGAVIEVNAAPGIRMHHYPYAGKARNVAMKIIDMLFPMEMPSRIPIVSVTGTNGKTTTTRMIGHILSTKGLKTGIATTDGIYINGKLYVKGDTTGPQSAKVVLCEPTVEAAVLETARGGIIRDGLGYDYSDVGIVTNISPDHLGEGGVENLSDLAYVKSLVIERVCRNGSAVLNADDKYVVEMNKVAKAPIIYFSCDPGNVVVRRHLGVGGKAVFVKNGCIVIANGNLLKKVITIKGCPATMNGLAQHNIQNALAAVAGCCGLGIDIETIRRGLMSFTSDYNCNPGRLNIFDVEGIKLLVDYGHNIAGYQSIVKFTKKMKIKKTICVMGMPGDRSDKHITEVGFVAGQAFRQIIIKEDGNLRGRQVGEVAELLKKGVLMGGLKEDKIKIILDERKALMEALILSKPGDLVVVFYEIIANIMECIEESKELIKRRKNSSKQLQIKREEKTIV